MTYKSCSTCGQPCWWNPAALVYMHKASHLDANHKATVATGTYLDSPGMRRAHLRSMNRLT